jgi:hypothetical protein
MRGVEFARHAMQRAWATAGAAASAAVALAARLTSAIVSLLALPVRQESLMPFERDGFLSRAEPSRVELIRERHAPWFAVVERLNRLAMSVLLSEVPKLSEELYVATLYARAVTMFQGAVMLAERGLGAESRTLVRGCAETAIALGAVRRDKTFFAKIDEDHDKHRVAAANDLLKLPLEDPNITAEQRKALQLVIAEVSSQYQVPHPLRINCADAAITAAMTDLYTTVYRQTSADAAHVSLQALNRHVTTDAGGNITGFRFHPEIDGASDTLSAAIAALLAATDAKLLGLPASDANSELRAILGEWSKLVDAQRAAEATNGAPPSP